MKILILDDEPIRHNVFKRLLWEKHFLTHTFKLDEFQKALEIEPDIIFLDYDLGIPLEFGPIETGLDAAQAIVNKKILPFVIVHSHSRIGAEAIMDLLRENDIPVIRWAFNNLTLPDIRWS